MNPSLGQILGTALLFFVGYVFGGIMFDYYHEDPPTCVPWERGGTLCIEENPHGDAEAIYTPPSTVVAFPN